MTSFFPGLFSFKFTGSTAATGFINPGDGTVEVANYAALPPAASNTGKLAYVTSTTGALFSGSRKIEGWYRSTGATWVPSEIATDEDTEIGTDPTGRTVVTGTSVESALDQVDTFITSAAVAITSSSAAIAWDLNAAPSAKHTITEATTMSAPSNMRDGATYILRVTQHASSPQAMGWNAVFKWPGGIVPVLTLSNSAVDVFTFTSNGTNMYGTYQQGFA